jgi:hypothetical protein
VVQPRNGPGLPQSHPGQLLAWDEELEGDHPLQLRIMGAVHLAHGPLAQPMDDLEAVAIRASQPLARKQWAQLHPRAGRRHLFEE